LNLLTILGQSEVPMNLPSIADAAGRPPSTTHRLLTTLQKSRYVRFHAGKRRWAMGLQAYMTYDRHEFLRNSRRADDSCSRALGKMVKHTAAMVTPDLGGRPPA
jgi:IclR family acetate operon transcriptional repressor